MGKHEKKACPKQIKPRYKKATKADKQRILDEFCAVCGYNRKYAIRVLNGRKSTQRAGKPGRKPACDRDQLLEPLRRIWLDTDQMCSKKLAAAIPLWLPFYDKAYQPLEETIKQQLLALSPATIDRLLKPARLTMRAKGLSGTRPGS